MATKAKIKIKMTGKDAEKVIAALPLKKHILREADFRAQKKESI